MASDAKTMLAVVFRKFGSPDVLQIEAWKKPIRQPGEVLVKMAATSVNPVDAKQRGGKFKPPLVYKLPKIPGGDVAGYIEDVDTSTSRFCRGDRVYGLSDTFSPFREEGTYAEMAAVKESFLTETPSNIEDGVAGATPLVALTALQALEPAGLKSGDRVLVHGGSGGVGHVAVQLAKLQGAFVVTTCSAKHADYCRGLGADEVVDYKEESFNVKYAHNPFDAVIDTVGGPSYWLANMKVLKPGGYYGHVLVGSWIPGLPFFINAQLEGLAAGLGYAKAFLTGSRYKLVLVQPNGSQMRTIARLQEESKLDINVASRFPLEKASAAHQLYEEGHPPGKIVIMIPPRSGAGTGC